MDIYDIHHVLSNYCTFYVAVYFFVSLICSECIAKLLDRFPLNLEWNFLPSGVPLSTTTLSPQITPWYLNCGCHQKIEHVGPLNTWLRLQPLPMLRKDNPWFKRPPNHTRRLLRHQWCITGSTSSFGRSSSSLGSPHLRKVQRRTGDGNKRS